MNLNSISFGVLFLAVFVLHWRLPARARNTLLLFASLLFCASWHPLFCLSLFFSIFTGYFCGIWCSSADKGKARLFLCTGIAANLSLLAFFKYQGFFVDGFEMLLRWAGFEGPRSGLRFLLPLGLSFYTFQNIGYLLDVYRKQYLPERNLIRFALFIAYFPKLIAGPIERAKTFLPQLSIQRKLCAENIYSGFWLIAAGLFKKVVIADNLAFFSDAVFTSPGEYSRLAVLAGIYAYTIRLYADFSGYTDMARGFSRMLGLELTENFKRPYFAQNPQDFWSRWHISLSGWIRDYIFYPLALLKLGKWKMPVDAAIFLSFVIMGIWHGDSWNFVLWGVFWGLIMVIYRRYKVSSRKKTEGTSRVKALFKGISLFHLVCAGTMLLGSGSVSEASGLAAGLVTGPLTADQDIAFLMQIFHASKTHAALESFAGGLFAKIAAFYFFPLIFYGFPLILYEWVQERSGKDNPVFSSPFAVRTAVYCFLYLWIMIYGYHGSQNFVYSEF